MTDEAPTEILKDYWSEVTDLEELRAEVRRFRDDHNRVCADLFSLWLAATDQEFGGGVDTTLFMPVEGDLSAQIRERRSRELRDWEELEHSLWELILAQEALIKFLLRRRAS